MNESSVNINSVRDFFAAVLARDADVLALIEAGDDDLRLSEQGFVFTLPALHAVLDSTQVLAYRDFRKLLYDSSLNQELSAFDAEVTLQQSSGKVDTSLYCLRRSLQP